MVEAEEAPARRGRDAPPQLRQHHQRQLEQLRQHHPQARASPSGRVAARQSRLHNFPLPPISWGNQRLLRCMKVESRGDPPPNSLGGSPSPLSGRRSVADEGRKMQRARDRVAAEGETYGKEEEEEDERLDKFRDSMMAEFRKAFDRIPLPPRPSGLPQGEQKDIREKWTTPTAASTAEAARPWNLRIRRAACNAPSATAENVKMRSSPSAPDKNSVVPAKYSLRSDAGPSQGQEERPKFSAVLSKEEIEEDYFAMTGTKPPRRPKKRPRNVQKQLEGVYPGFYLTEVTPDLYKITEEK